MRVHRFLTVGLVVAMLGCAARSANAQTTAVGPYYATPSWDQKLPCSSASNCPRFIVLSNWNSEAVLDRETGLVWERSPSPLADRFGGAYLGCLRLDVADRQGWRLPTFAELSSLVDGSLPVLGPSLPPGHPFDTQRISFEVPYWTATFDPINPGFALLKGFTGGSDFDIAGIGVPTALFHRWCVRGGQGSAP